MFTSLRMSVGVSDLEMKKMVFVPLVSHVPRVSLPNLLVSNIYHLSCGYGLLIRVLILEVHLSFRQ